MIRLLKFDGNHDLNWRSTVESTIRNAHKDRKGACACVIDTECILIGFGIFENEDQAIKFLDDILLKEELFLGTNKSHIFDMVQQNKPHILKNVSFGPFD